MPTPFDPNRRRTAPSGRWRRVLGCMSGQQRQTQTCPETPRLDGRLALVTGGSTGIGAALARGLAERGAAVVVLARGGPQTAQDCADWSQSCGAPVTHLPCDLGDMAAVIEAVAALRQRWPGRSVDIVCANAGVWPKRHAKTRDGFESAFAVNCLGHHLLIRALLDRGLLADQTRIVGTTGDIYVLAEDCTPDFAYRGRGLQAYCRSKLGNLWQFGELARRHPTLCVVCVHPGVVASGLEGPTTGLGGVVKRALMISPALGAQASLIAATQPLPSGSYFHNTRGIIDLAPGDPAADRAKAAGFWDVLDGIVAPWLGTAAVSN